MWGGTKGPAWARCELTTELSPQLHNYFRWLVNTQTSSQKYTLAQNTGSSLAPKLSSSRDGTVSKTTDSSTRGYLVAMAPSWQWGRKLLSTSTQESGDLKWLLWELFTAPCPLWKRDRRFSRWIFFHTESGSIHSSGCTHGFCVMHKIPEFPGPGYLRRLSSYNWVQCSYWGPEFCSQHPFGRTGAHNHSSYKASALKCAYSQEDTHSFT